VENRTRIELPPYVTRPFEVFVNGVPQAEGPDYEHLGSSLVFPRRLAREGKLGFWRWLRMALGVAGSYRQNDSVDVVFTLDGRRIVKGLLVPTAEERQADPGGANLGG
jgi:hypothetical protein